MAYKVGDLFLLACKKKPIQPPLISTDQSNFQYLKENGQILAPGILQVQNFITINFQVLPQMPIYNVTICFLL